MNELQEFLKLLKSVSDSPLLVAVVILWGARKWLFYPIAKEFKEWGEKIKHYFDVHDENLYATGRIERYLKAIHDYIFKEEKPP